MSVAGVEGVRDAMLNVQGIAEQAQRRSEDQRREREREYGPLAAQVLHRIRQVYEAASQTWWSHCDMEVGIANRTKQVRAIGRVFVVASYPSGASL